MTKEFGFDFAKKYGTAHERVPGNPEKRAAMDLFNNSVGREIASTHPNASWGTLAKKVNETLQAGGLVVLGRNQRLAWSDQVRPGQTSPVRNNAPRFPAVPGDTGSYYSPSW